MYYRILENQDLIGIRVLTNTVLKSLDNRAWWMPVLSDERHYFDHTWTVLEGCFLNDGTMVAMSGLFMSPEECAEHALEAELDPCPDVWYSIRSGAGILCCALIRI